MNQGADRNGRDERGRFTAGNPGGPGGPRSRAFTLRRAVEEAVTEEHVQAMIRRATRMGLEGNLAAMRLVLERVSGKVADAPTDEETVPLALPRIRSAADCDLALERVVDALCRGSIGREMAETLIKAIQTRLRAIELTEVEGRLAELEQAASLSSGSPNLRSL